MASYPVPLELWAQMKISLNVKFLCFFSNFLFFILTFGTGTSCSEIFYSVWLWDHLRSFSSLMFVYIHLLLMIHFPSFEINPFKNIGFLFVREIYNKWKFEPYILPASFRYSKILKYLQFRCIVQSLWSQYWQVKRELLKTIAVDVWCIFLKSQIYTEQNTNKTWSNHWYPLSQHY